MGQSIRKDIDKHFARDYYNKVGKRINGQQRLAKQKEKENVRSMEKVERVA
jgi:hypothetical protein